LSASEQVPKAPSSSRSSKGVFLPRFQSSSNRWHSLRTMPLEPLELLEVMEPFQACENGEFGEPLLAD
jgi:hypothetical protein